MALIRILFLIGLFPFYSAAASPEWVGITSEAPAPFRATIVSQAEDETVLFFRVEGFSKSEVQTPRGNQVVIQTPGASKHLSSGMPDLPVLTASVIIPDDGVMIAEVVSSSYQEFNNIDIAPSKGNLYRDQDPAQVPYEYSARYSVNAFFPESLAMLRDPYILRDFRGQTVVVQPFQYNPVTRTLRVYFVLTVKIRSVVQSGGINVFNRQSAITSISDVYAPIYASHFLNFNQVNYMPLQEQGKMLVLCPAAFRETVMPLVNWKNRSGIPTEFVDIATVGYSPYLIKTFLQDYYFNHGLTFLLLVGDDAMIPPYPAGTTDSDPSYGYILGSDSYAEVIVGRLSANDTTELITQIERTLNYEMHPDPSGSWYARGICVASNQGPGDDNEMDFEHARLMRQDLINDGYSDVAELYDGSQGLMDASGNPGPQDLTNAVNLGAGVITYTGHGSTTSCSTTGFGLSQLPDLTNAYQLPFFWSVACVNGNFVNRTCLAEGLLRSTDSLGRPTGAVATLMSTINQSWDPPMDGQDEMVDLLVNSYPSNVKHTFGGISVNGCMHMNDNYGPAGSEMTDTWTCFGDPSLMVRTKLPVPMTVVHPVTLNETEVTMLVSVSRDSARVCLSKDNQFLCSGIAYSGIAGMILPSLTVGDTLDLTVTAFNAIPYMAQVVVVPVSTGISDDLSKAFNVFPVPTTGTIHLQSNFKTSMAVTATLCSLSGQEIRRLLEHQRISSGRQELTFALDDLPAGTYLLRLTTSEGVVHRKLVVY